MSGFSNVPFANQGLRNVLRDGAEGNMEDLVITGDLSCNGTATFNKTTTITNHDVSGNFNVDNTLTAKDIIADDITINDDLIVIDDISCNGILKLGDGMKALTITDTGSTGGALDLTGVQTINIPSLFSGTHTFTNNGTTLLNNTLFVDASMVIGSTANQEFQFEVRKSSNFAVNVSHADYAEIGNLQSSSDTLQVNSFGNVEIICDANGNSTGKSIKFMSNGRLGTGNNLMKIEEDGTIKMGDFTSNSDMLLALNGNAGRNGVLQIVSRSDGGSKEIDGACFKPTNNGNNIINFQNTSGNDRGQIKGNGSSAVQYQTSSDRRLKTNIVDMDSQLNNIMNLIPRKYNWIEDISEVGFGFIAQEVHNIYPEMRDNYDLTYCADNPNYHADCPCDACGNMFYYGLDYGNFTPYIIKAFQEYKTATDTRISNLESQVAINNSLLLSLSNNTTS